MSESQQKIIPNLWFDHNAAEAGEFYADTFPSTVSRVAARYPTEGLLDFQEPFAGQPLVVELEIGGYTISLINAGPEFPQNAAGSFMIGFDPSVDAGARERIDEVWAKLADGGSALMPLGEYPFSARYGWVRDRYGVNWQLVLADPDEPPQPAVIPALLFGGAAQNRAREAIDFYTSLFDDGQVWLVSPYPAPSGPATEGAVQFGGFALAGQWFAAMDSGVDQDFTFTPAFSLEIRCADQAEIDHYWDALSSVPEAEQCGWCVDRFGVSWQVNPAGMDELMARPDGYQHVMDMKKIVIADI